MRVILAGGNGFELFSITVCDSHEKLEVGSQKR